MQGFGLNQPGVPQTKNAIGLRARPSHHINLVSLDQMLAPMCEHNKQEELKRTLVPASVQLLAKAGFRGWRSLNISNTWSRNSRKVLPFLGTTQIEL